MTKSRDTRHEAIWSWQKEIKNVYEEENLRNLSGLKMDFVYNDRQVLKWYFDTVRLGMNNRAGFDFHQCFDDMVIIVDEILYATATLYLYRPYMNNPLQDGYFFHDRMVYPNSQNLEAKRYDMFSNIIMEKLYNFWDRIGDLIAAYFPDALPKHKIYYSTILQAVPKDFKENEPYQWLSNFNENEFKELNKRRKEIVHYTTLHTRFKHDHLEHNADRGQMERILDERYNRADFSKENLNLCLKGFEKAVELIEIINPRLFPEDS